MQSGNHPTVRGIAHDYVHLPRPAQLPTHHRVQRLLREAAWWGIRAAGITVLASVFYVLGAFTGEALAATRTTYVIVLVINGTQQMPDVQFTSLHTCRQTAHSIVTDPRPFDPNHVLYMSANGTSKAFCRVKP